jgi:hypothetical protein
VINRSTTRDNPHFPVALYEVDILFGTLVAETILASVHVRAHKQAGHMGASDLIKALQNTLQGGGRPHMESGPLRDRLCVDGRFRSVLMYGLLRPDWSRMVSSQTPGSCSAS